MGTSPYSPEGLACARSVVSDADWLASVVEPRRAELVTMALEILRKDRAARHPVAAALSAPDAALPRHPGQVIPLPHRPARRRPQLVILPHGPTPGDAA